MALTLQPLVSLADGRYHPDFPLTLLNFWVLTSEQLDDMAHFYHQSTPGDFTSSYPCPVEWRRDAALEDKRRKIGRFIGLRGCETPIREQSEEEIREEMRRAAWMEDEELMFRRKFGPGRL
ncbi:Uncharacterized protein BP5553_06019 [Venustampulla echinocandica]|uniref:Beta-xylosidase n=1 Tax=Venustampulla echinocandica TaxID=2656787 RepID=A0A370TMB8_9HELO|nr:Uncharacterized protein BP5553_06019 [Venustampulla echinocandica]RDL36667.1 Uncharacterized protein BP5553_06019 [Venustampulla echinocandica]